MNDVTRILSAIESRSAPEPVFNTAPESLFLTRFGQRRREFSRLSAERGLQCGRIGIEPRACFFETPDLEREHQRMTRL